MGIVSEGFFKNIFTGSSETFPDRNTKISNNIAIIHLKSEVYKFFEDQTRPGFPEKLVSFLVSKLEFTLRF